MRRLTLLLIVLGLASSLWAADPRVGTWKLNIAQTKSNQPLPKEETVVCQAVGDRFEVTFTGIATNGSPFSLKTTYPAGGGETKYLSSPNPQGTSFIATEIEPTNWYTTMLKDGKQVRLYHYVISKDGKTMRATATGMDSQGKPINALEVWDKQ